MEASKPHRRQISTDDRRRVAIPRRTTIGPLDVSEDPLSDTADSPSIEPARSSTISPDPSLPRSTIASPLSPLQSSTGLEDLPPTDLSFLLEPSVYHPIPPQSTPQPFLASPKVPSLNTPLPDLLSRGYYRIAAVQCARALTTLNEPENVGRILTLFHTRLACLTLLSYHDLAAQESKALGDLTSAFWRHPFTGSHIVPWSLRVLCVRLSALGYGEWRKGIMSFYELAREAREEVVRSKTEAEKSLWIARLRELGVRVANLLVEMGDLEGAAVHLSTVSDDLNASGDDEEARRIQQMEAMVWLRVGNINAARRCFSSDTDASDILPIHALTQMADNDYEDAATTWRTLLERSAPTQEPLYTQNLAVCLLYTGRMDEARDLLEQLVKDGNSFHTLTFNLSTIYELCTERARDRKLALANRVAAQDPGPEGWEKTSADFKL